MTFDQDCRSEAGILFLTTQTWNNVQMYTVCPVIDSSVVFGRPVWKTEMCCLHTAQEGSSNECCTARGRWVGCANWPRSWLHHSIRRLYWSKDFSQVRNALGQGSIGCQYSQLYLKRTPSGPKLLSTLERVQVTWYPNLQIETRAFVQGTMITWQTSCISFTRPNGTQHSSYELAYFIKSRDIPVIPALFSGLL